MRYAFRHPSTLIVVILLSVASIVSAQPKPPHTGYVFPAGGRQGESFDATVGGQYLKGIRNIYISGKGVKATVEKYIKPLTKKQVGELNKKMRDIQRKRQAATRAGKKFDMRKAEMEFKEVMVKYKVVDLDLKTFVELRKKLFDPKRQPNAQIAELVNIKITIDKDARPGEREMRLQTPLGISNPIFFHVGQWKEYNEEEPNNKAADDAISGMMPVVINGQIMPGDVDRFRFRAKKGDRIVASVAARELIPYLADAVPGWFQATLTLYDHKGGRVAYADDFRFHPDPVLSFEVPADGQYDLEIKDAIYRGREDFVYRITLGQMPYVTGIFPLGGRIGEKTKVQVKGWNLPEDSLSVDTGDRKPGVLPVSVSSKKRYSNTVPFAMDTLPECMEKESDDPAGAQKLKLPVIVNGRIGKPGDIDIFEFKGKAGDEIVAEIWARRLGSPLDSVLKLTDSKGNQIGVNDDHEDKGAGLTTHHADSKLSVKIPEDGVYRLHLGDTQNKGGDAYGYRLHITPKRPDFQLRVVPSSISAIAGMHVPITVYALREDGFAGDIHLSLKDVPDGFYLSGAWIPDGCDKIRLTLTVPRVPLKKPANLRMVGRADIDGEKVSRRAVPAEDMMQAFLYRHLVPSQEWMIVVGGKKRFGTSAQPQQKDPVKLPAGGTAKIRVPAGKGAFLDQIKLELSEPPAGVAIEKFAPGPGKNGMDITISVDQEKSTSGLKGNLIVNAFIERTPKSKDGKKRPARRFPVGALPAIPFEITGETKTAAASE